MKCLLVIGICSLFVPINAETLFDERRNAFQFFNEGAKRETEELFEDAPFEEAVFLDETVSTRNPASGLPKNAKKPGMEIILEKLRKNGDKGIQMFTRLLIKQVNEVFRAVQCPDGKTVKPTRPPSKEPSGLASIGGQHGRSTPNTNYR